MSVTITTMEFQTGVLSTLAECHIGDVPLKSNDIIVATVTFMTSLV